MCVCCVVCMLFVILMVGLLVFVLLVVVVLFEIVNDNVLCVLVWFGYVDSDIVSVFEVQFYVCVEVMLVDFDEVLWMWLYSVLLLLYDVLVVNMVEIQCYVYEYLFVLVDLLCILNWWWQLLNFQQFVMIGVFVQDGVFYVVLFIYLLMGLIYDCKQVLVVLCLMCELWNLCYCGKVFDFNSVQYNFLFMVLVFGYFDLFCLLFVQMFVVVCKLIDLCCNLLIYYMFLEEVIVLFVQYCVVLMFGNYGMQQVEQLCCVGVDVGYVILDEGVFVWFDCWVVMCGVLCFEFVFVWINYMFELVIGVLLIECQGFVNMFELLCGFDIGYEYFVWFQFVEDIVCCELLWGCIVLGDWLEWFGK